MDAALQCCNIRLSDYVSTTDCRSYSDVVEAIASGEISQTRFWSASTEESSINTARTSSASSARRSSSRGITHGNKYLRQTIIECAWDASRTRDCFYAKFSYHQTVVRRKSRMKVLVAIARKMLTAIWFILHDGVAYRDFEMDVTTAA